MKLKQTTLALSLLGLAQAVSANELQVVNGEKAAAGAFPWMASVDAAFAPSSLMGHFCGGALIHPSWVLTAAHCLAYANGSTVSPKALKVTLGRTKLSDDSSGQRFSVDRVVVNPNYNADTNDGDIALLKLSVPALNVPTLTVAAANLASPVGQTAIGMGWGALAPAADYLAITYNYTRSWDTLFDLVFGLLAQGVSGHDIIRTMLLANGLNSPEAGVGYTALVQLLAGRGATLPAGAGFDELYAMLSRVGVSVDILADTVEGAASIADDLMRVSLPIVANSQCLGYKPGSITDGMLCAGYTDQPKDTCQGDSGGPLVVPAADGQGYVQVGIVSFGGVCATGYGIYTNVSKYAAFVAQTLSDCGDGNAPGVAPNLAVSVSGQETKVSWTSTANTNGYLFYYAPYSDPVSATTLNNTHYLDLDGITSVDATLPSGSAFYVAARGYNCFGRSPWSNIGTVMVK